ncbi:MAG: hypothetical protein KAR33_02535 [Candidatus Thorarchaeota archaeon]|nr:hypothetical protein [Candidatus Thorarchaeota archaeon]
MTDIYNYHEKESYPSHKGAIAGLFIVFAAFIAYGAYSLSNLWTQYGSAIILLIDGTGIPTFFLENLVYVIGFLGAIIIFTILVALGASVLANRLGGTLIYIGAIFMNIMAWLGVLLLVAVSGWNFSILATSWPIMIPGIFTLFITLLLFTVFKERVRRAGEIIKLTGQVCLDEKGVFVPPLLTMIFTLVSAVLFAGIIFQFTPLEVLLGTEDLTLENGWPLGVGLVLYLFVTIFFYNFSYGTTSGMVYLYMRGKDPALGDGVKSSLGVIGGLIVLSILSVFIMLIRIAIQALTRKSGAGGRFAGNMASGIIGIVWFYINYFTIPAMVAEELSATKGIKRSVDLVRKNFVDVIIKETAVRWGFGVLAFFVFVSFAAGGAVIGWFVTSGDVLLTILVTVLFVVFAAIPSTLILRTFDIVYVTLLYVFIRRKEGDITGKTAIPSAMSNEMESAYTRAKELQ